MTNFCLITQIKVLIIISILLTAKTPSMHLRHIKDVTLNHSSSFEVSFIKRGAIKLINTKSNHNKETRMKITIKISE